MRWKYVLNVVGILTLFLALCMVFPLLIGLYYADGSAYPFLISILLAVTSGTVLYLPFRREKVETLTQREGMGIVAIGWTVVGLFGAFPFYFGGVFDLFVDAFFESISGFTTTGSSVLTDIETVSEGLLFWRAFNQWLGGMGIIVLSVAILPFLGIGGMQLYKAEVPSPVPDKLKPRIRDTAMMLWKVYALISAVEVVFLMIGGMDLYDAICHTFTTMPTGGFSTKNASVMHYDSVYIDVVITVFMFAAGINFSLHYQLLRGKPLFFWRDSECRFFLAVVLLLIGWVTFDIYDSVYQTVGQALRYGSFQVVSIITTTGFATADYEKWPVMSQLILLLCMFFGASAGSTGGGVKAVRVMICVKYCYKELFHLIHPRAVRHIKIAGNTVPEDVTRSILGFLALYVGLFALCSVIMTGIGLDMITAVSSVSATLGNIGPGLGLVGPADNYAAIPTAGKWLLIWCMLLGRLEIYTVIILFIPEFWRK
jgi:trk system potassium uptake protein TrkH